MCENKEQTGVIESMEQGAMNASGPTATETVDGMKAGVLKMSEGQTVKDEPEHTVEVQISQDVIIEYHIYHNGQIKYRFVDKDGKKIKTTQELRNNRNKGMYFYYDNTNTMHILTLKPVTIEIVDNMYCKRSSGALIISSTCKETQFQCDFRANPAPDKRKCVRCKYYFDCKECEHRLKTDCNTCETNSDCKKCKTKNDCKIVTDMIRGDKIYLVDITEIKPYTQNALHYKPKFQTSRFYPSDVALASLIGAILAYGNTDIQYRGASSKIGESTGGSTSHKNGYNVDFGYLRQDKRPGKTHLNTNDQTSGWPMLDVMRQNQQIQAFARFGWKNIKGWEYWNSEKSPESAKAWQEENEKNKLSAPVWNPCSFMDSSPPQDMPKLEGILHLTGHHHHLHLQGYQPSLQEMQEISAVYDYSTIED